MSKISLHFAKIRNFCIDSIGHVLDPLTEHFFNYLRWLVNILHFWLLSVYTYLKFASWNDEWYKNWRNKNWFFL